MKKYLLSLFLVIFVGTWMCRAQVPLTQYRFEMGTDATKWVTLSSSATTLLSNGGDAAASPVTAIGFDFLFGGETYSQFSVNSDGRLRFGPTQVSTGGVNYGVAFDDDNIGTDLPRIDLVGVDAGMGSGGYVKYELTGTAPNRVLVIEFKLGEYFSYSTDNELHYQIQLSENNGEMYMVYGPTEATSYPEGFQIGMATSTTDVVLVDYYFEELIYGTTDYGQYTWPEANTYFHFWIPNCVGPVSIVTENITGTSADISWTAGGSETEWEYVCLPLGTDLDWSNSTTTTAQSVALSNLQGGLTYNFYIRSLCSDSDTSDVVMKKFTTECGLTAIPYVENFDSYSTDISDGPNVPNAYPNHVMPSCWTYCTMSNSLASGPSIWLSTFEGNGYVQPHSIDSVSMHFLTSSDIDGGNTYAALPLMEQHLNDLMISLDCITADMMDVVRLGVMTDPNDYSTFMAVDTLGASPLVTRFEHMFVEDNLDENQTYYIAIDVKGDGWYGYTKMSIDNIVVDFIPTCLKPMNLVLNESTATTVELNWESEASSYEVAYREDEGAWNYINANDTIITITGLAPTTEYLMKVRAICASDDTSAWSDSIKVKTECGIYSLPYESDFAGAYSISGLECWSQYRGYADAVVNNNAQLENDFGLWGIEKNRVTTNPHLKINIYGSNRRDWVVTPTLHIDGNAELSFWLAFCKYNTDSTQIQGNVNDDRFYVMVTSDNGASWQKLATWGTGSADDYRIDSIAPRLTLITLPLASFNNQDIRIAFYAESTVSGGDNDLHVADIKVEVSGPYCSSPRLKEPIVTEQSAIIAWKGDSENYEVNVKVSNEEEWEDAIIVNDTTYAIDHLMPQTEYNYQVRQICGDDFYSNWSEGSFTTLELICRLPDVTISDIRGTQITVNCATDRDFNAIEYQVMNEEDTLVGESSEKIFNIKNLMGNTEYRLIIRVECIENYYSDWSDTLTFTTKDCLPVSEVAVNHITEHTADLSWTVNGDENEWQIIYGEPGFDIEEGKMLRVNSSDYRMVNLHANTQYEVYVRAVCSEDFTSLWSTPAVNFRTEGSNEGIDGVEGNYSFELYPNPASSYTTIKLEGIEDEVKINLIDINGRVVISETMMNEARIDLSHIARGTYFVQVVGEKINSVRKLIIR